MPLARLWKRTSKAGGVYFTGRLGQAKLLAFPATDPEGTPTLDLVLVPGEPRERTASGDAPAGAREPEAPRERGRVPDPHPRSAWAAPPAADDGGIPF